MFLKPESRIMVFVDGENLAIRYRELLASTPQADHVKSIRDVFVWSTIFDPFLQRNHIVRKYYFTSSVGSDEELIKVEDFIRAAGFEAPRVYKKQRNRPSKRVDVSMCCEMLSHGLRDNFDCAIVISGDGDFVPAVEALINGGKQVILWYLASGASKALIRSADHSFDLSNFFLSSGGIPWGILRGDT